MNEGRESEALAVLANLRRLDDNDMLVQMEFLELKAQRLFETRVSQHDFPNLQDDSRRSKFMLGLAQYKSLFANRSNLRRTTVAVMIMLFQQWTAVNGVLYYAPFLFRQVGLNSSSTISLLASGVVGVVMFLATIPAVLYVDSWGRKPTLIAGAVIMAICHFVVAGILKNNPESASGASGWVAAVFIWIFAIAFGFSWGPCAWIVVAEVFPLGLRAKGISIGASSNWLNNFAVAMSTPDFVDSAKFGAYVFFGLMCVLAVLYVWFLVPETKQRSLDELDQVFGDKSGRSVWEAAQLLAAQREVGLLRLAGIADPESDAPRSESPPSDSDIDEKKDDALNLSTA